MTFRLVVATRESEADFFKCTALGRSLEYGKNIFGELRLFANNSLGLSKVYNQAIREAAKAPATLAFIHDDVHILDYYWCNRVQEGLQTFDIVGVAGNVRRLPGQPSWAFTHPTFAWDSSENLSGVVGVGKQFPPPNLSVYGLPRQKVKLLDGMLIGCRSETLLNNELFFDERYDFHFYDMDFCRQAELLNLSCGTWDMSLIHESGGSFDSGVWRTAYQKYLEKWGD